MSKEEEEGEESPGRWMIDKLEGILKEETRFQFRISWMGMMCIRIKLVDIFLTCHENYSFYIKLN